MHQEIRFDPFDPYYGRFSYTFVTQAHIVISCNEYVTNERP